MPEPRFKPGDFVVSKVQMEALRLFGRTGDPFAPKPTLLHVMEARRITCYGGTQDVYVTRAASPAAIADHYLTFVAIELDPAPTEPPPEKE